MQDSWYIFHDTKMLLHYTRYHVFIQYTFHHSTTMECRTGLVDEKHVSNSLSTSLGNPRIYKNMYLPSIYSVNKYSLIYQYPVKATYINSIVPITH